MPRPEFPPLPHPDSIIAKAVSTTRSVFEEWLFLLALGAPIKRMPIEKPMRTVAPRYLLLPVGSSRPATLRNALSFMLVDAVIVRVPVSAVLPTLKLPGLKAHATNVCCPQLNLTWPLYPPDGVSVSVIVPDCPGCSFREAVLVLRLKSAFDCGFTVMECVTGVAGANDKSPAWLAVTDTEPPHKMVKTDPEMEAGPLTL